VAWKLCIMECMTLEKTNQTIWKQKIQPEKHFMGASRNISMLMT
jgi:hypothetical protein